MHVQVTMHVHPTKIYYKRGAHHTLVLTFQLAVGWDTSCTTTLPVGTRQASHSSYKEYLLHLALTRGGVPREQGPLPFWWCWAEPTPIINSIWSHQHPRWCWWSRTTSVATHLLTQVQLQVETNHDTYKRSKQCWRCWRYTTDFNALNAMYVEDIEDGVCSFNTTLHTEYCYSCQRCWRCQILCTVLCIQGPSLLQEGRLFEKSSVLWI